VSDTTLQIATPEADLSHRQSLAIEAIVGGATVTAAAEVAGVSRATLHRWLAADAAFVATLNVAKQEHLGQIRGELRALATDAVKTLKGMMEPSRPVGYGLKVRVALAVLKMVGADTPEPIGSTDPGEIQHDIDVREMLRSLTS
jgi:hypothetical protein